MQSSLKYCTKCLMPDTRPNIKFVDGICTACINFEKQKTTDWKKRLDELKALCDKYRGVFGMKNSKLEMELYNFSYSSNAQKRLYKNKKY